MAHAEAPTKPGVDALVVAEQVKTLYRQSIPVLLANVVNALLVGYVVWDDVGHPIVIAWCTAMLLMSVARVELRRRFWVADPGPEDAPRWGSYFVLGSFAAGSLWGFAGSVMFVPDSLTAQLLVGFVIGGMGAGAAGTLGCHIRAFHWYFFPSLVPFVIRLFAVADVVHVVMGGMVTLYTAALAMIAIRNGRLIVEAYRLRFENAAMAEDLQNAAQRLEQANATLDRRVKERTAQLQAESVARRDLEKALAEAQKMEAVGRLTSGVAHDFNNLLTVVMQSVAVAREQADVDPTVRYSCDQALAAAHRGASLIKSLLGFAGEAAVAPVVIDTAESVRNLASELLPHLFDRDVEVRTKIAPDVHGMYLETAQFETSIMNLALNAKDAMPEGGVLTLEVENGGPPAGVEPSDDAASTEHYVVVRVRDDGRGMPADVAARAFEPFYTTKTTGSGSGLGLSQVYGFVRRSRGHLRLHSAVGEGTTVELYLPAHGLQSAESAAQTAAQSGPKPANEPPRSSRSSFDA